MKYCTNSGWSSPCFPDERLTRRRVLAMRPHRAPPTTGSPGTRLVSMNVTIVTPTNRSREVPADAAGIRPRGDLAPLRLPSARPLSSWRCPFSRPERSRRCPSPHRVVDDAGDVVRRRDVASRARSAERTGPRSCRASAKALKASRSCGWIRRCCGIRGDLGDRRVGLGRPAGAQADLQARAERQEVRGVGVVRAPEPEAEAPRCR